MELDIVIPGEQLISSSARVALVAQDDRSYR